MATVSTLGTAVWNTTSGTHTVTATPAVGDLIVLVVANSGYTATTLPTDNNSSGTYVLAASGVKVSSGDKLDIYVRTAKIAAASSTVFTHAAGTTTGGGLAVFKITGMTLVGAAAIRQAAKQDNVASGTPAPVFGSAVLTTNPVIGAIFNGNNPATMTPRTGFTEGSDLGYNTPTSGLETIYRSSGETGTTMTWGSASGVPFTSAIVELNANTASPTVVYTSPSDASSGSDTTPALTFTGTDADSDDITYEIQIAPTNSFGVDTYYFDGSDQAANDEGSSWSGVTNADDGNINTDATYSLPTSGSTSTLNIEGTNAPGSGGTITQVRARVYGSKTGSQNCTTTIRTDSEAETLGTIASPTTEGYSAYTTLSTPSGGWTWAKVQALESDTTATTSVTQTGTLSVIEVEVTSSGTLDKLSASDSGFSGTPDNSDPFASGQAVTYTVQGGDALSDGTYYWRVRGKDPLGMNVFGDWSTGAGALANNLGNTSNFNATGPPTTLVLTTSATANVGETIIVSIGSHRTGTVASVADSAGNTYTLDLNTTSGQNSNVYFASAPVTSQLASGGTITVTWGTGVANRFMQAASYAGVLEFDTSAKANTNALAWNSGATAALTNSTSVVVAASVDNSSTSGITSTSTNGFTELYDVQTADNVAFTSSYKVVGNNTAVSGTGTWSSGVTTAITAGVAVYKARYRTFTISSGPAQYTRSHSTDANKRKAGNTVSHTADAYKSKPSFTVTHTADGYKQPGSIIDTITYDTSVSWAGATTQSYTVGAGNNRILLVFFNKATAPTGLTGITYGGVSLTGLSGTPFTDPQGHGLEVYYLKNPTVGTANIVLGGVGGAGYGASAITYYNVDQTTTFDGSTSIVDQSPFNNTNSAVATKTTTVANARMLTSLTMDGSSSTTDLSSSDGTVRQNLQVGTAVFAIGDKVISSPGAATMTWLRSQTTSRPAEALSIALLPNLSIVTHVMTRGHTTDAYKAVSTPTYTRTHTTDANKRKTGLTLSHTADALKRKQTVKTHSTDANKRVSGLLKTHTTDALRKKSGLTKTHTTDSFLRRQLTRTHTTDSNKKKSGLTVSHTTSANKRVTGVTKSHTTDAFKRKAFTPSHTTDANRRKSGLTASHTTDANKKKSGLTVSHTTSSNKRVSGFTKTHTTDSFLRRQPTKTHSTDANKKKTTTVSHSTDANKKKSGLTKTHTTDTFLRKGGTRSHTTDVNKRKSATISHSTDTNKRKSGLTVSHTTSANKRKSGLTLTHTTDANLSLTATVGPLYPTSGTNDTSSGSVVWVSPGNIYADDGTFASASLGMTGNISNLLIASGFGFSIPAGSTINGVYVEIKKKSIGNNGVYNSTIKLVKGGVAVGTNQDSGFYWQDIIQYDAYGSSSYLWGTTLTPADVNASNFGVAIACGQTGGFNAGYVDTVRVSITYTPGIAASTYTVTHTTDSFKRKQNTLSHTTSANKRKATTASHTTDANKKVSGLTRSHTTDANKRKAGLTRTHTTDAFKRIQVSKTHTTDAFKRKTNTLSHTTSANKRSSGLTKTHTTDALKRKTNTLSHTTDARLALPPTSTATYYFDASDAGPTDTSNAWSNDANAFNGNTSNFASVNLAGSGNALKAEGTNAPTSGGTITQVRARAYIQNPDGGSGQVVINSDGAAEQLASFSVFAGGSAAFSSYTTLTAPTGGWSWTAVDALEVVLYNNSSGNQFSVYKVEIEVTYSNALTTTVAHTTDANKRKVTTAIHTTDANKKKAGNTVSHTTSANKRVAGLTRSHTTDSLLRKQNTRTHTTDTFKRKQLTLSHTTDALKRKSNVITHTTDSFLRRQLTKFHTTDGNKRKATTVSHTTSSNKRKTFTIVHSTDANKRTSGLTRTHTTDALKRKQNLKTHTTDTLKRSQNVRTHTTDSFKRRQLTKFHTTDGNKRRAYTLTHTTDANKRAAGVTRTHTTDTFKRKQLVLSHSTDANKRKATLVNHITDANKRKAGLLKTHTTDAFLRKQFTKTHTTDGLKRRAYTAVHSTDANKKRSGLTVSHSTDANKRKTGLTKSHTTDTFLLKANIKSHTTDTNKRKVTSVSHTTDTLRRAQTTKTHTTDSLKRKQLLKTHTTDTLKRTQNVKTHTTDANKRKAGITKSHTTDALKHTSTSVSHTTDTVLHDTKFYTRESNPVLPTDASPLDAGFSTGDYGTVSADDSTYVCQPGYKYLLFNFESYAPNNLYEIHITWNGKSSIWTDTRPVYLQIWNNVSSLWETLDMDNSTLENTDFTLSGDITIGMSPYYDGANKMIARVYQ